MPIVLLVEFAKGRSIVCWVLADIANTSYCGQ